MGLRCKLLAAGYSLLRVLRAGRVGSNHLGIFASGSQQLAACSRRPDLQNQPGAGVAHL